MVLKKYISRYGFSALYFLLFICLSLNTDAQQDDERLKRGEYIFHLGGCTSCHTNKKGEFLAGGLAMETQFGTFYTPNISADKVTGIGGWSEDEFIRAIREGVSPEGQHYYPSFPYTSYTRMTDHDLRDLKYYLDRQPAVFQENKPHDLVFPFSIRSLLYFWKLINFDAAQFDPVLSQNEQWNRGAYIVQGPGHCAECHSPRNWLGGIKNDQFLKGNPDGPEDETVPGLRADAGTDFSEWSLDDILLSLQIGMLPDGDFVGGSMGHVIDNSTSKLKEEDQKAIAYYLYHLDRQPAGSR